MIKEYIHKYKIGVIFIFVLCVGVFLQLFTFNETFSKEENRALEKMPSINLETWMSGEFQGSLDTYVNDHFFKRASWMRNKTVIEQKLGVSKMQGIYMGSDNMLLQDFVAPTSEKMDKKTSVINAFLDKHQEKELRFMLVPNAISMYSENLPKGAIVADQNEYLNAFYGALENRCEKVDVRDIFKQYKEQSLYYKSDHHWTTQAAKYAFDAWLVTTSLDNENISYEKQIVNDSFQGTLDNKIAYYDNKDVIEMFVPTNDETKQVITYKGKDKKDTSLYVPKNQFSNDPYTVFMGGNHPLVEIATTANEDKRLLIFKDSYANCFIPFLIPYYSEITVVDPRYYYEDIDALINEKEITDILFLYNMNTFFTDSSLEDLLGQ